MINGLFKIYFSLSLAHAAKEEPIPCYGPAKASLRIIYLHGLEESLASKSREENRHQLLLEDFARTYAVRIASPKAQQRCQGKLCWRAQSEQEVKALLDSIRRQSAACLGENQTYLLLGFSNGGYFAFKVWRYQEDPLLQAVWAVGSAGQWRSASDRPVRVIPFRLMIGKRELSLPQALKLEEALRATQGSPLPVRVDQFEGGHGIDRETLVKWLAEVLALGEDSGAKKPKSLNP